MQESVDQFLVTRILSNMVQYASVSFPVLIRPMPRESKAHLLWNKLGFKYVSRCQEFHAPEFPYHIAKQQAALLFPLQYQNGSRKACQPIKIPLQDRREDSRVHANYS